MRDRFRKPHTLSTPTPLAAWELDALLRRFHTLRGERGATAEEVVLFVAAVSRCDHATRALILNAQQDVDIASDGTLVWGDLYAA